MNQLRRLLIIILITYSAVAENPHESTASELEAIHRSVQIQKMLLQQTREHEGLQKKRLLSDDISSLYERSISKKSHKEKNVTGGRSYATQISRASEKYGLSPALLKAVIHVESRFDKNAVSRKGAMGLMQLMPETAKEVGVYDPFDPDENIMGGARLLREHIERFGSLKKALVAYNAGPVYVVENRKLPTETQVYLLKVVRYFRLYLVE